MKKYALLALVLVMFMPGCAKQPPQPTAEKFDPALVDSRRSLVYDIPAESDEHKAVSTHPYIQYVLSNAPEEYILSGAYKQLMEVGEEPIPAVIAYPCNFADHDRMQEPKCFTAMSLWPTEQSDLEPFESWLYFADAKRGLTHTGQLYLKTRGDIACAAAGTGICKRELIAIDLGKEVMMVQIQYYTTADGQPQSTATPEVLAVLDEYHSWLGIN